MIATSRQRPGLTLAPKIILSVLGVLVVLAIGVSAMTFAQVRRVAFAELERKGTMLADTLNYTFEVLLGQEAFTSLQRVTENSALMPDVQEVMIAGRDGVVRASSDRLNVGNPTRSELVRAYLDQAVWQPKIHLTDSEELVLLQPLRGGRSMEGADGDVVGVVQVTLDRRGAEATALSAAFQLLGISLGGFLLLSVILVLVLRMLVVQPLQQLAAVTQRFRNGERSSRSQIRRADEIGLLATAFDDMANNVETLLQNLQAQVAEAEKARAAAEQANELKSQFLANMSHELRTPLNSIINFTMILSTGRRGPVNEAQLDFLNRVRQSGEHLLGLINDILDLSKIEAGRMELMKETLNLAEVVTGVMKTAAGLTKGKPIELRQEIGPDLPPIQADRTRVRQILLNLLSNAAKFTDRGTITVRVERENAYLVVRVSDTGIGIAPEHQSTIFEEFRQIEGSSNRRYEGTGLGLAIVRRFVDLHGGRIWVESTPGVGSTFAFSLPIGLTPEVGAQGARVFTSSESQGIPILVIDDDPAAIEIVAAYLDHNGYTVYGVTDSRLALDEVRRLRPAAIILDVLMPYKDGWEVLTDLKADPELQSVPVALYTIVEEQKVGFYIGASAYLTKPINEEQLRTTVAQLVAVGARVMVIDDDSNALEIVTNHLEQCGPYHVVTANSGRVGLQQISVSRPDLIILDLMMPEVDGFAVLDQLDRDPQTRNIPVIVLTAKDLTRDEHEFLQQRVNGLLAKGVTTPEQLLSKVTSLLGPLIKRPMASV